MPSGGAVFGIGRHQFDVTRLRPRGRARATRFRNPHGAVEHIGHREEFILKLFAFHGIRWPGKCELDIGAGRVKARRDQPPKLFATKAFLWPLVPCDREPTTMDDGGDRRKSLGALGKVTRECRHLQEGAPWSRRRGHSPGAR